MDSGLGRRLLMLVRRKQFEALRRFGNVPLTEEREMWGWSYLETAIQDVQYGLR
jgi:hypothetical protein